MDVPARCSIKDNELQSKEQMLVRLACVLVVIAETMERCWHDLIPQALYYLGIHLVRAMRAGLTMTSARLFASGYDIGSSLLE